MLNIIVKSILQNLVKGFKMSIVNKDNKLELLKLTRNNYKDSKESLVIDINKLQYNKLINKGVWG